MVVVLLVGLNINFIGADNSTDKAIVEDIAEDIVLKEEVFDEDVNDSDVIKKDDEIKINESDGDLGVNESFNESVGDPGVNESFNESVGVEDNFGYEYINIDDLGDGEDEKDEVSDKKISKELVKDGLVELEFEVLEGDDIEISKKEVRNGDFEKDVLISSDEHFDDEVVVFSNLPSPALEKDIVVIWENEDEIVSDLEYFDLDFDGLIDRISWVVPHLSDQYYSIKINVNDAGNKEELEIIIKSPLNGSTVSNPINFSFGINYVNSSDVDCKLAINNTYYDIGIGSWDFPSLNLHLGDGAHSWILECCDNSSCSDTKVIKHGNFNVKDYFKLEMDNLFLKNEGATGKVYANGGTVGLFLINGNTKTFLQNISNVGSSGKSFSIASSKFGNAGKYSLKAVSYFYATPAETSKDFNLGTIDLDFDSTVDEDEVVSFVIKAKGISGSLTYDLYADSSKISGSYGNATINHTFSKGDYDISLRNIKINGGSYDNIDFGDLDVSDASDDDPEITLVFPDEGDVVRSSDITFKYNIKDDVGVSNCSLKIYESTKSFGYVDKDDDLIFPVSASDKKLAFEDDLDKSDAVKLRLVDFDEGYYAYDVTCYDDVGNKDWYLNYFSVNLSKKNKNIELRDSYDREDEVGNLIEKMNSFLENMDSFDLEERRVLEILDLDKDMSFWKKRVVQMDQDLKFNLKFMEEDMRRQRIKDIYEEIDEIEEKVILDIRSIDSYEFSKGSIDLDLSDVIRNYLSGSGAEVKNNVIKSLVNYNKGLQKYLGVSVEAWKLELEYLDGTQEIVLVNKNLDVSSKDDLVVLEVIEEDYDAVFISDVKDFGNGIYSVDVSNLEDGNLIYYFKEGFALKEVEKMESILFGEGSGGAGITGMFVGVGDSLSLGSFFWLPLFLFLGYFGVFVFGKFKLESWKKEPGVEEIVRLINETKRLIREGKVEVAKGNYTRMGEIYRALPVKCRDFFYKEIKRIRLAIDKKDVLGLIKEYEAAKDSFRKDDAMILHNKINMIYKKLPKKFQEKVFRRLIKKEV